MLPPLAAGAATTAPGITRAAVAAMTKERRDTVTALPSGAGVAGWPCPPTRIGRPTEVSSRRLARPPAVGTVTPLAEIKGAGRLCVNPTLAGTKQVPSVLAGAPQCLRQIDVLAEK